MHTDRPYPAAPTHTAVDSDSADEELANLRRDFTGHRIWRGVRSDGSLGDWVASLHDPSAGVDPTVIQSSPAALREALVNEAARAEIKRAVNW
ncbi:hypothetical protein [Actinomadura violacea]|uniref:Uncharacterized protein n=1 Tax=Actinomadura violacea TaxID=2819934 RepID=A0ABS3RS63_9ACTN|nr:hypothetical protein [Actinomadura violacea]MBO2459497.1 hypothetical protein [Actinomadura violacea]